MLIVEESDKVTVNSTSPGVAEMTIGEINSDPDEGTTPTDDDEKDDDEMSDAEKALERILGAKRELGEINRISTEMRELGLVSKEHRLALEAFDEDGVLPHRNGYTASPSRTNYDVTNDFVGDKAYHIACNTLDVVCKNMSYTVQELVTTLSELPTHADMTILLNDHNDAKVSTAWLKPPAKGNIEALDNDVLTEGLKGLVRTLGMESVLDEMLEAKSIFHTGESLATNMLVISRFHTALNTIVMYESIPSLFVTMNEDYESLAKDLLMVYDRVKQLDNYNDAPVPQTPLAFADHYGKVIHAIEHFNGSHVINNVVNDTSIKLLYNPNNDSGEHGMPYDMMVALDRFATTIATTMTEPDRPDLVLRDKEVLAEAVHVIQEAISVYILAIERFVALIRKSIKFNEEFSKIMDATIHSVQDIITDADPDE